MTVAGHLYQSGMLYKLTSGEDIEPLLKKGARVNQILMDGLNSTPLHVAVDCNHIQAVKNLIAYGANLNAPSKGGYTPLMKAMKNGQFEIVDLLVNAGAYLNSKDDKDRTPLWWASYYGQAGLIPYLVQKGANVNVKDSEHGLTPLMVATKYANAKTVEAILSADADMDATSFYGHTALHYAIMARDKSDGIKKAKLLIQKGVDIHQSQIGVLNTFVPSPLVLAVTERYLPMVELLLNAGADGVQEAFLHAQKRDYKEIMSLLLPKLQKQKNIAVIDLKVVKEEPVFIADNTCSYVPYTIKNNKRVRQKM